MPCQALQGRCLAWLHTPRAPGTACPRPRSSGPPCIREVAQHATYRWTAGNNPAGLKRRDLLDNMSPEGAEPDSAAGGARGTDRPAPSGGAGPSAGSSGGASTPANGWPSGPSQPGPEYTTDSPSSTSDSGTAAEWPSYAAEERDYWEDWGGSGAAAGGSSATAGGPPGPSPAAGAGAAAGPQDGGGAWPGYSDTRPADPAPGADSGPEFEDWSEEGELPDVTLLTRRERAELLPVSPTAEQLKAASGGYPETLQRVGGGLLVALLASKYAVVAAPALTFPIWWPWLQAMQRNSGLQRQYRYVGLWRARVVAVDVTQRARPRFSERRASAGRVALDDLEPSVSLLVGDDSGARSQLSVPYADEYEQIVVGEPAELLVLSNRQDFQRFKALREVYLPESGVWLSAYPYVNRDTFLDISLAVERERQAAYAP